MSSSPLDLNLDTPLHIVLAGLVQAVGGQAGVLLLWDARAGQAVHTGGVGLPAADLAELAALVAHAAPALLGALPPDNGPPDPDADDTLGADPPHGWRIDPLAAEARINTRLGRLHLLTFPATPAGGTDGAGAAGEGGEATGPVQLHSLLCVIHPHPRLDLRHTYPLIYTMVVAQVHTVLHNLRLVQQFLSEAHWLQAVLEHTSEGLIILDAAGRVLGANAACEQITGWAAADLRGRELVPTLDLGLLTWTAATRLFDEEPWAGPFAAAEGKATTLLDLVLTTRSGARIYSEGRVSVVRDGPGLVLGAVLGLRDVTAQREAEELQATFLSVISHELQTPLAIIRGYAELLADRAGQVKPPELRQKLGIVAEESAKLSKMVTNLLDASRIQAEGLELRQEPISLHALVERVVQKIAALSQKHQFVVGVSRELPPVLADYERVEQVLTNLLENAIKYSPAGGTISITDTLTSDEVIIHVSDQGIGVPEADRQRVFSRFHRLNSRQVRQMKGVGLGLYIARAIIGAHGGRIWADAAPGGGAQFSFSLPRQHKAPLPILFGRG